MDSERAKGVRRYVRLPEDCISLCAENLGVQASREVTAALVEDVSFRIRQVTQVRLATVWGRARRVRSLTAAGSGVHQTLQPQESLQGRL